ncbi:hypothetical protein [Oligoflexus tunisiensis]|uniref:hypothetical protein n=1 Tax=Oligoflexus tunisiensis TaxID=708132 RepID=UPI00114C8B85|nr:hypothetical protein [Oligoflexus tunisiensis]
MATPQHPKKERSSDKPQFKTADSDGEESEKGKIGLTPGLAEGDRETVDESIKQHEQKGDL